LRRLIVFLACLCASSPAARAISIVEGFAAPAPGISFQVLREVPDTPALCATPPIAFECSAGALGFSGGVHVAGTDAAGAIYSIFGPHRLLTQEIDGYLLRRITTSGADENVAIVAQKTCPFQQQMGTCQFTWKEYSYGNTLTLDLMQGRILVAVLAVEMTGGLETDRKRGVVEIRGLPAALDVALTYVPPNQLVALTPGHPDGFESVDTMQIWAGDVRTMPDWGQAQPVACEAALGPMPGQLVTVTDTLPDPPVGTGRYYLVSTVNAGERRLGRQYLGSGFSARNPTALPLCNP
jgi:hypothetical protein